MINGIVRKSTSKQETKKLRRDGYLIANIYGKGVQNINAAFKTTEFSRAIKSKTTLPFSVKLDNGDEHKVVIQDYQKEPVNSTLLHVDLRVVLEDVVSKYLIPVKTHGTPKGLKNKGVLVMSKKRIKVKCLGKDIPNNFDLDVSGLDVGDAIMIRDMEFPAGVVVEEEDRVSVVGIIKAK